jgi:hypothetical protein
VHGLAQRALFDTMDKAWRARQFSPSVIASIPRSRDSAEIKGVEMSAAQPARKRTIVDAQVHLWKAETPDWRWVPGRVPQLPEPFTIEKLVAMMDEAGVDRVVIVPPSWPGDRNDYALEAAKRYPGRFAVMGRIPLEKPESAALLPRWKEQPGMLGVRLTLHRAQAVLLEGGSADWFWPAAEKAVPAGHVPGARQPAEVRPDCGAPPAAAADHRPHEPDA